MQKADLVTRICGTHGGNEIAEVCDVWRSGGGHGLRGGAGRRVGGVSTGGPQSFRYQRRPVNDCGPGRGGTAQDGGTRGGTFDGEMDCCRKSQSWTTAYSKMLERDGKDQGEGSSKQALFLLVSSL